MTMVVKLKPDIFISPFEGGKEQYIVKSGTRHFLINKKIYHLLLLFNGENTLENIAAIFSSQTGKEYRPEDIEKIIKDFLAPYDLLILDPATQSQEPQKPNKPDEPNKRNKRNKPTSPFTFRLSLLSPQMVAPFSKILRHLFWHPLIIAVFSLTLVIMAFLVFNLPKNKLSWTHFGGMELLGIYFIIILSTLFHELGHASACRKYDCDHGTIGVGFYLLFPIFYTDVTEAWRLARKERAVIDLGGIYFQAIFNILLAVFYLLTNSPIYLVALLGIYFAMLISLNPFFRYDGYWLFSDLLGIPNLRKRSLVWLSTTIKNWRAPANRQKVDFLPVSPGKKAIFCGYAIFSNLFFLFFFWRIFHFFPQLIKTYPLQVKLSFLHIISAAKILDFPQIFAGLLQLAFPTLLFLMFFLMLRRFFMPLFTKLYVRR